MKHRLDQGIFNAVLADAVAKRDLPTIASQVRHARLCGMDDEDIALRACRWGKVEREQWADILYQAMTAH